MKKKKGSLGEDDLALMINLQVDASFLQGAVCLILSVSHSLIMIFPPDFSCRGITTGMS